MKKGGAQHTVQPHSDLKLVFENMAKYFATY